MSQTRAVKLWNTSASFERRATGEILMRSAAPLEPYPKRLSDRLVHWATVAPDRTFMAKRNRAGVWRHISYREAHDTAQRIGQALLDRGLSAERPLVILSENDLVHAMMALAADYVGVAFAPISSAYSLMSKDFDKLKHIINLLTPGAVYVASGARYGAAIDAVISQACEVIYGADAPTNHAKSTAFSEIPAAQISAQVEHARQAVGPDTIAKFLFTSGSTSAPKGVINTQRMLCSNQQMIVQAWPFLADEPPVMVDWLVWNHTFGGNHNVGITLYNGGTLYLDDGKPVPALFHKTLENLREIPTTIYFNVPRGFEELAHALHADAALAKIFFSKIKMWFYAGASLPQPILDSLQAAARKTVGEEISMQSGLGMTETAPWAIGYNQLEFKAGLLGIPGAGMTLKLVPTDGKLELRYKGDNVTPGYWRAPEITQKSFDDEGYFLSGDAVKIIDERNPTLGLRFDGRIAEDFKLITGTWVSVGPLRGQIIGLGAPFVQDVVITGHDRAEVGAIVIPHVDSCRKMCPDLPADAPLQSLLSAPQVLTAVQSALDAIARDATGSARRVARAVVFTESLSLDKGEVTDKGSVNQRAVIANRAALVQAMYSGTATNLIVPQ